MADNQDMYLGIDISSKYTILSVYNVNMDEPQTVSTVVGTENYTIPTAIAKKNGLSQWYFGDEAIRQSRLHEAVLVEELFNLALKNGQVIMDGQPFHARELLVIFFKKLFTIPGPMSAIQSVGKIVFSLEKVDFDTMELMNYLIQELKIDAKKLLLLDRRESFYYYALSQNASLFTYDVALFDFSGSNLVSCMLHRNSNTRPQVVDIDLVNHGQVVDNKDGRFLDIIGDTFGNKIISSVYLVGDGFDGDWMKESLSKLCRGRKVYLGKNLYSKGASYAGAVKGAGLDWPFIYIGDNDLKLNLSIRILDDNEMKFFTLIDAGQSWYDAKGECEVIIDGPYEIEFYIQRPESRDAHMEVLELTDMPVRENRTTRVRIEARPISDKSVTITIVDLGFGEISPGSGKTWEHTITLKQE